ncbi:class I SAM-dependent methyltransferase [Algirhabdus cladophorae]|uniref:class I SAM-dependent methyltransferase n=1 Tax=Algirhabdus cladophorae TaxID=3377108 RepID=UPI003B845264
MASDAVFWSKAARKYAASAIADPKAYAYTLELTKEALKPTDRVLELGCGTGSTAVELAPLVADYLATDFAKGMIEIAAERQAEADIHNLTCAVATPAQAATKGPFDVVLALNLLHLVDDIEGALADVVQATQSGGLFISKTVTKPAGRLPLKIKLILAVLPLAQWLGKAPFVRFDDAATLEARLTQAGFEILQSHIDDGPLARHYVIARRL